MQELDVSSLNSQSSDFDKSFPLFCKILPLPSQVAGHPNSIFLLPSSHILKNSTPTEITFYLSLPLQSPLSPFLPRLITTLDSTLTLENITSPFSSPCICDVKLGTRLHDHFATVEKAERMNNVANQTTTGSHGLRICGMLVDDMKYGKEFGKSKSLEEGFRVYLSDGDGGLRVVVGMLIERIEGLIQALKETDGLRLYSSSLLLVYEGDPGKEKIDVRLIDFAHSYWQGGKEDDGVLFGLGNLWEILNRLAQ
jgi:hypothetical protein